MLLLVSLLAAAGHALSTLELRTSDSHRLSVEALYRADGALKAYLGAVRGSPAAGASSSFPGGTAEVTAHALIRLAGGERLYHASSRAEIAPPGGGVVRKAVGTLFLAGEAFRPPGALLFLGTLQVESGSLTIDGTDDAGSAGCGPAGEVAGLAVLGDPPSLPPAVAVAGSPAVLTLQELGDVRAASGLDWAALLGADGPEPDATLPGEAWPAGGSAGGEDGGVVVRVDAPLRLDGAHAGRGAILASGDLELGDGFEWEGLVLVGGRLRISGSAHVRGAVAAGLGRLAGGEAGGVILAGTGADLRFHSCHASAAAAALGLPAAELPSAWYEEMEAWF